MSARVLVMAGGTGGHVFPALAVADELRSRGFEVSWLGTRNGLEADVVPKAGFEIDWISISGLRGKGLLGWLKAPLRIFIALMQARRIQRLRKPQAVLGMGGFVTGPGGLMAWMLRIPLLVHEQNAIPGLTNRLLSRFANVVMEAFPGSFTRKDVKDTGNPLRSGITHTQLPNERFAKREGAINLLVIGGSLGAVALNKCVPQALRSMPESLRPQVWHQTGTKHIEQTQLFYQEADVKGRVVAFIDDMAEAYAWADLVICRAGALTISELAAVGVASILVPYPFAVDDHQTVNARYLVDSGAALLLPQNKLDEQALGEIIRRLANDRERLLEMANAARSLGRPQATQMVANLCQEVMGV
ncbi:MAG: undecaprenyldiphospho-muramoylpentapeptide beta-N-acetylglucosaminyltransferase [Gammaproteobacteria bacterium]|nr:undecaprenyldiphospho-muramoylpentapeptide beta-N-acetylglucosaminyltransferase [Gammaproteobacteria bacterium]MDH5729537.1 undecaprenyldiphospho-muramoylpentapeptide beta-N-acetylglucosaminyltransferase [Gammaproteobacteria bacterium]